MSLLAGEMAAVEQEDLLEADIQEKCVAFARYHGVWARKFASPQNRAVPDYILCWQGVLWFVEFKRKGKRPTPQQHEEHKRIRAAEGIVWVCDGVEVFKERFMSVVREPFKCVSHRPSDYLQ